MLLGWKVLPRWRLWLREGKKKSSEGHFTIRELTVKEWSGKGVVTCPVAARKARENIKALQIRNKQWPDHRLLHLGRVAFEDDWNPMGTSLQDLTLSSPGTAAPAWLGEGWSSPAAPPWAEPAPLDKGTKWAANKSRALCSHSCHRFRLP